MADANGSNESQLTATDLGALVFDTTPQSPTTVTDILVVDSVGLFDVISLSTQRMGDDSADYFSFRPSGINTITVTMDHLSNGTFANIVWIAPVSGVTKVSGDIIGSWYGGVHASSSTVYRTLVDDSAKETLRLFQIEDLVTADVSDAGWNRNDSDGISAVWTLDGSPVVFEVVGFNLQGNPGAGFANSPNPTFQFSEISYSFDIAPRDRALGKSGPGSLLFTDTSTVAETHTGGDAVDLFQFSGLRSDFGFQRIADDRLVVTNSKRESITDTLIGVERIEFSDGGFLAFDTDGNAGQMYRLYQAAFDRDPDVAGLGHWINTFDNQVFDLVGVAEEFLNSEEFQTRFGTEQTLDDQAFLTLLYNNVLDRDPDQAGFDFWSDQQDRGLNRADILQYFSESEENYANVAAEIDAGIFYL